ncbi:hypothetical protein [Mesorhizobium carmichaelinearum]|uniref:hypothetical protein n=1 Tax=Mesorhizobium carmichaelinearum TaxID=1208188 RepID=UPI00117F31DB|nr:hypothetical protein [Mesorhizobium carmichaelinearum]
MMLSFCAASECQCREYRSSFPATPACKAIPGLPAIRDRLDFSQPIQGFQPDVSNACEKTNAPFTILT